MRRTLFAALLLSLVAVAFGRPPQMGDKPDKKEDKPEKVEKPAEPRQPPTLRIEVILRQAKDEPKGEKADDAKKDDPKKSDKTDKTDKAENGSDETLPRYVDLLRSKNRSVRKQAILVLLDMGSDAFPALLEATLAGDKDPDIKRLLGAKVIGGDVFSTPEKIEALLKALADASQDVERRKVACLGLESLYPSGKATDEHRKQIKKGLQKALIDDEPAVQEAAVAVLERLDAKADKGPR